MNKKNIDTFLEKRLSNYDKWLGEGKIKFSSKVVPVNESIKREKWVIPTEQVLEILGNARSFALSKCECRSHYQRCDNPLEVCFLLDDTGDKLVEKGLARHIDIDEAANVLKKANENGLVHLSLYKPDHEVYALCSCCPCCCHDLRIIKLFNREDLLVRSEYAAVTEMENCIHCGKCVERCIFDARTWKDDKMLYNVDDCYGCGLCVTSCPVEATVMQRK